MTQANAHLVPYSAMCMAWHTGGSSSIAMILRHPSYVLGVGEDSRDLFPLILEISIVTDNLVPSTQVSPHPDLMACSSVVGLVVLYP